MMRVLSIVVALCAGGAIARAQTIGGSAKPKSEQQASEDRARLRKGYRDCIQTARRAGTLSNASRAKCACLEGAIIFREEFHFSAATEGVRILLACDPSTFEGAEKRGTNQRRHRVAGSPGSKACNILRALRDRLGANARPRNCNHLQGRPEALGGGANKPGALRGRLRRNQYRRTRRTPESGTAVRSRPASLAR